MPAVKGEKCVCHLCLKISPEGRFIPFRQQGLHLKQIEKDLKAQNVRNDGPPNPVDDVASSGSQMVQDEVPSNLADDVTSKIFAYTLTDNPNKNLFRRYTSHTEYPETPATVPIPDVAPITETVDAVIDALEHLEVGSGKLSNLNSLSKRERNILTTKAHASLSQIEKHVTRLLSALESELPSPEVISTVEKEFQTLQTTFFGLKRKTDSLEKRKIRVRESFSLLEARIVACRSVHPASTSPILFNSGKPVSYKQMRVISSDFRLQNTTSKLQSTCFCLLRKSQCFWPSFAAS